LAVWPHQSSRHSSRCERAQHERLLRTNV